jgi:predicted component of type VI protein secretion system
MARFPFLLGRAAGSSLQLSDPGVWDAHAQVEFDRAEGFTLRNLPPAITRVNDAPVESARLKNGDVIELGSARLRFWLSAPRAKSWRMREAATWLAMLALAAAQVALIRALW